MFKTRLYSYFEEISSRDITYCCHGLGPVLSLQHPCMCSQSTHLLCINCLYRTSETKQSRKVYCTPISSCYNRT